MDAVRLFLAIDIPPRAREIITALRNRFKPLGFNASWVAPENVHLTLQFLGDTPPEQIPDIHQGVSTAVTPVPQFMVTLKEIGVFPKLKKPPRTLWVGMEDPKNRLTALQKNIAKQMQQHKPNELQKENNKNYQQKHKLHDINTTRNTKL